MIKDEMDHEHEQKEEPPIAKKKIKKRYKSIEWKKIDSSERKLG